MAERSPTVIATGVNGIKVTVTSRNTKNRTCRNKQQLVARYSTAGTTQVQVDLEYENRERTVLDKEKEKGITIDSGLNR